jgi:Holliday junction resolvase RusA-like endonuclease
MQESFRDALLGLLPSRFRPTVTDNDDDDDDDDDNDFDGTRRGGRRGGGGGSSSPPIVPAVLFSEGESLRLSIIFRMKRPASHFVAGRRTGPSSRLKPAFSSAGGRPMPAAAIRSDVDNLAKFVMDSLNGVLYVDDRQVVNLNVVKVLDSEGPCFGATEVEICVLREEDMML